MASKKRKKLKPKLRPKTVRPKAKPLVSKRPRETSKVATGSTAKRQRGARKVAMPSSAQRVKKRQRPAKKAATATTLPRGPGVVFAVRGRLQVPGRSFIHRAIERIQKAAPKTKKAVYTLEEGKPAWAWGKEREPGPLPEPDRVVFRGPRGRFLSRAELERLKAIYEAERAFAERRLEEKRKLGAVFPVDDEVRSGFMRMLDATAERGRESNLDFQTRTDWEIDGHIIHAKLEVSGLTSVKEDEGLARDQINDLVMSLVRRFQTQKLRKGLAVQFSFIPEEATYLQYGREGDLMTTAWADVTNREQLASLVVAAERMTTAMIRNGWDIRQMRVAMFYDNAIASGKFRESPIGPIVSRSPRER